MSGDHHAVRNYLPLCTTYQILLSIVLICCASLSLAERTVETIGKPSKATMKSICEMPEFQKAMAADEELEPAAVVYEVMSRRLEGLESHIQQLEKKLDEVPTQQEIEAVAAALRLELLEHVDEQIETLTADLEVNVEKILRKLVSNLAGLQFEYGYEQQSTTTPTDTTTTTEPPIKDCSYLAAQGYETGVHALSYDGTTIEAYCEITSSDGMDGSWLVFQRRIDSLVDFYRDWNDYKMGFGDMMGSFYLGNENLHVITEGRPHLLRVELTDAFGDKGYAEYSNVTLSNEKNGYRLHYHRYVRGPIGDGLKSAKGTQFSTYDRDNDGSRLYSCAKLHKGGFWFDKCGSANPNGIYYDPTEQRASPFNWQNVFWYTWKRDLMGLKTVVMKIRPQT